MESHIYDEHRRIEDCHWWFIARRRLCAHLLRAANLPPRAQLLEAGCGSGGNLPMLAPFGEVYAFEIHDKARKQAAARSIGQVASGSLPGDIPFADMEFNAIVLCDVLEHIDDDAAALQALAARLKPGGALLLTVPAFPFLFSHHDAQHHHKRRYTKSSLRRVIEQAGLEVEVLSYWNCLLFLAIATLRLMGKILPASQPLGMKPPPAPINRMLADLVGLERFCLRFPGLPWGVSLIALARKLH